MPAQNGLLNPAEQFPMPSAPVGEVNGHPLHGLFLEKSLQFFQNLFVLECPCLPQAGHGRQNPLLLLTGQQAPVQNKTLHETDASALASAGIHRESCHGQAVNVPVDGAGGHLEMRRQFFRCHRTLVH